MIDFQIHGNYDQFVKTHIQLTPTFASTASIWTKSPTCFAVDSALIPKKRHAFIKMGKTSGVELTRYAVYSQGYMFYYMNESEECFKGYCRLENLYAQWAHLHQGKQMLILSNGTDSSCLYFREGNFRALFYQQISYLTVQIDFKHRYERLGLLGKGHFSWVYEVRDRSTNCHYAAKIQLKRTRQHKNTEQTVLNQRQMLTQIDSPYVQKFIELHETEKEFIFILELLKGKDLMSLIRGGSIKDTPTCLEIIRQLLAGLADIHNKGIIHRDIKPQNVLVSLDDGVEVWIVDFGLALQIKEVTHIQQFKRCGTVGYIAPEVMEHEGEGKTKYGTISDVFSCGIIAHMLLLGKNPLKGLTYEETVFINRDCLFQLDQNQLEEKCGPHAFTFMSQMLSKYPNFRFTAKNALKSPFLCSNSYFSPEKSLLVRTVSTISEIVSDVSEPKD